MPPDAPLEICAFQNGPVVALRAAGGEVHLFGSAPERGGELFARIVQHGARLAPQLVRRAGVAVHFRHHLIRCVRRLRAYARRRGVIEINFHIHTSFEERLSMKYIIATLGCKVNQYESEAMEQLLQSHGHTPCAEGESADAVIVNTCAVTAEGARKARARPCAPSPARKPRCAHGALRLLEPGGRRRSCVARRGRPLRHRRQAGLCPRRGDRRGGARGRRERNEARRSLPAHRL